MTCSGGDTTSILWGRPSAKEKGQELLLVLVAMHLFLAAMRWLQRVSGFGVAHGFHPRKPGQPSLHGLELFAGMFGSVLRRHSTFLQALCGGGVCWPRFSSRPGAHPSTGEGERRG